MFAIIARIFVIGAGVFLPMACASVPVTSLPKLAALAPALLLGGCLSLGRTRQPVS